MDVNMELSLENVESENIQLIDAMRDLETEKNYLEEQVNVLEKKLDKEKRFHRKFADDVSVSEAVRLEDFRKEKGMLVEENKSLTRENRQLKKDVDFYKKAHEEQMKEQDSTMTNCIGLKSSKKPQQGRANSSTSTASPTPTRRSGSQTVVYLPSDCTHKSSKVLSKTNDKLFQDNKKLQLKISQLNATIAIYKKKNKQLENFKTKIDNKKTKFLQDSDMLEEIIASTKTTNKDTYNPEVLNMFGNLLQK